MNSKGAKERNKRNKRVRGETVNEGRRNEGVNCWIRESKSG